MGKKRVYRFLVAAITIVLSTYITVQEPSMSALSMGSLSHRATHHGTGKDRPYVHDSGRGREAVCVSMRSGKGDKRFFCIRGSGTRLLGQCDCHWSAGAGMVALGSCQLGLCRLVRFSQVPATERISCYLRLR